jgi:GH24 family phage-related lysozyme (muramidase)
MQEIIQYIWPATTLVIFFGMLAVVWRSLTIAHDLAKIVLQQGMPVPQTPVTKPGTPAIATKPTTVPTPAPATTPVVDAGLVNYVKKQEGFSAKAFWDYKQYTIGYGTKASGPNETITEADATAALEKEIAAADALVESFAPGAPKGVKQALTDLTYNAGPGWEQQGLGSEIKAGNYAAAKQSILQYNHAGGQVLAGLTARRETEASWFDSPI